MSTTRHIGEFITGDQFVSSWGVSLGSMPKFYCNSPQAAMSHVLTGLEFARPSAECLSFCGQMKVSEQMRTALALIAECFKSLGMPRVTLRDDPSIEKSHVLIYIETVSNPAESIGYYKKYLAKWIDSTTDEQRDHFRLVYRSLQP